MIPELGFETTYEVGNLLSIAHLFPKNERCGIYCLKFSNNQFYIGRAIDFVRRFVQHRKTYDDIVEVSFFKVPPNLQSEPERKLIHKAEAKGFKLRNIVETSVTYADSDFDELFLPSEQEKWLITAEVKEFIYRISGENIDNQRIRYTTKFNKLKSRPDFDRLVEVLKLYIQKVIPFYRQTEMSFWSVSCLPSTKAQFGQRLFVINMNEMECLVVLCDKEFPKIGRAHV